MIAYLARTLTPEGFGIIGFAGSFMIFLNWFVNLGLGTYGTREIAKSTIEDVKKYVDNILSIRMLSSLISYSILMAIVFFIDQPKLIKAAILINGLNVFANAILLDWVYQGSERMEINALWQVLNSLLNMVGVLLFVNNSDDVIVAIVVSIVVALMNSIMLLAIYLNSFYKISISFDMKIWWEMLKQSLPLAFSAFMVSVYYSVDMVLLGFFKTPDSVGLYNAAYKIITTIGAFHLIYYQIIYPVLSKLSKFNRNELVYFSNGAIKVMNYISVIMFMTVFWFADEIILIVFGPEYSSSVNLLRILIFALFLIYNQSVPAPLLWSLNKQKLYLYVTASAALINFTLNLYFIPKYGPAGAAFTTIFTEFFVTGSLIWIVGKYTTILIFKNYIQSLSILPLILIYWYLGKSNILYFILILVLFLLVAFFDKSLRSDIIYLKKFKLNLA